jgi:Glycoside hydrolase family 44
VAVDPTADAHPVSPLIFGINFPSDAQIDAARLTVGRWGGNGTTRYNYQTDVHNSAFDYYYENLPGCWNPAANYCASPPADPQESSAANAFLADAKAKGITALFTIPTIGYVPKPPPLYAHPFDCGCPMSVSTSQDAYDPYDTNCGKGQVGGHNIDCGPASNTSVATDATWTADWVTYLVGKFGAASGKRIYALDNEPALWSSTHHDLRPMRLGYDELWQRMRDTAVAIHGSDPTALISGPAEWGWPNYLCSDADDISLGCSATSPDRAAHGGEELMAWLLDQAAAYERTNAVRILDYLDLHYYPQGGDAPEITRSLWDPSYTDPSWINAQIRLIPRMRDWVAQHYPGTKIAVSEYDFGHHNEAIGAVTYAEVLGIFAREGLDMATAWSAPSVGEAAFGAYVLYRNFDGAGGHFESTYARTTVTGTGVAAFGAVGATQATVALANENATATGVQLSLGSFPAGANASVYQLGSGSTIVKQPDVALSGGTVSLTLPPTSIAMVVVAAIVPDGGAGTTGGTTGGGTSGGSTGGGTTGGNSGTTSGGATGASGKTSGCSSAAGGSDALAIGLAFSLALGASRRRRSKPRGGRYGQPSAGAAQA